MSTVLRRSVGAVALLTIENPPVNALSARLRGDLVTAVAAAEAAMPWVKRVFHLYTGRDNLTRIEELKVPPRQGQDRAQLLRRHAVRLTLSSSAPNYMMDFHVANQPTLLIPIFGSIVVGLHDGSRYEFGHGDFAYAEDCNGKGHVSGAGKDGSFTVQVQLDKSLCRANGSFDMTKFWVEPD